MNLIPIWSDSLGAKSFSFYIEAGGVKVFIDPGVAVMQPSYPADRSLLFRWYEEAYNKITDYLNRSNIVIITHYHHDHYLWRLEDIRYYRGKSLLVKDPNKYINDSQWERAREFLQLYLSQIYGKDIEDYLVDPYISKYRDYVEDYEIALEKDFGEYNSRRLELLDKGRKWFLGRVDRWLGNKWVREYGEVKYADSRVFVFGDLKIRFTDPLYHGIEYSRTGWVLGVVVEYLDKKIIYTSDIQGPTIEDYASWIIKEDPDILLLDGPPTYLIPYMFNLINFRRTIENIKWILRDAGKLKLVIYDHHLTRDIKFRNRVDEVYRYASKYGKEVLDMAEYLGVKPAYEVVASR